MTKIIKNKRIVRDEYDGHVIIHECPVCHGQPTMLKQYNNAADWIGYVFLCCSLSSGEFKPLHLASSAWADAVERYIQENPNRGTTK